MVKDSRILPWLVFLLGCLFIWCTVSTVAAVPANWYRSDEGLSLTSSAHLFSFDHSVYVSADNLYVGRYHNNLCFGWSQVNVPAGAVSFKPVGSYLYASGLGLWWSGLGDNQAYPIWNAVTSTGLPAGATLQPRAMFKGYLYAIVVTTPGAFDIYRTPDIGKTSMSWSKVVSAGFGDPLNHELGILIEYNNKLIAVTTNTRTDPIKSFGDYRYYGTGIEVWESPTGDAGSWTQVNTDGFGTEVTPPVTSTPIRSNQDFGSAAVYKGYIYVGTLAHFSHGEVWRYDGTGAAGWTEVTPDGMCAGMFGCGGPSRAAAMVVYNNLLYLGEGVSTGNLETSDGKTWTIVVGTEVTDPNMGHPFHPDNIGIYSLAVFPTLSTFPGRFTEWKLFALTKTQGGAQIWSYPFVSQPIMCDCCEKCTNGCPQGCWELPPQMQKYCKAIIKDCVGKCSKKCQQKCDIS